MNREVGIHIYGCCAVAVAERTTHSGNAFTHSIGKYVTAKLIEVARQRLESNGFLYGATTVYVDSVETEVGANINEEINIVPVDFIDGPIAQATFPVLTDHQLHVEAVVLGKK